MYSFGVLLWEMFHGMPPYAADNGHLVNNNSFPRFDLRHREDAPFSYVVVSLACLSDNYEKRCALNMQAEVAAILQFVGAFTTFVLSQAAPVCFSVHATTCPCNTISMCTKSMQHLLRCLSVFTRLRCFGTCSSYSAIITPNEPAVCCMSVCIVCVHGYPGWRH